MTAMKVVPHELLVWAYSKLSALGLQNGSMDSALKMDEIGLILQGAYEPALSAVEPAPDGLVEADGEFEIIDRHNCRHRFDKKRYRWSWGIEAGTIDRDDHKLVVVFDIPQNDDEEGVVVKEFPFASQVGDVGAGESLNLREVPVERCPRCAFAQPAALTSRAAVLEEAAKNDEIKQWKAKAQVCMDLHDALGVKWGDDPYARIRRLLAAEKWADDAVAYLCQPKDKQTFEGARKLLDAVPTFREQDACSGGGNG